MKRLYSYLIVLMAMSTMMIACEAFDDLLPSIDNPTEVPDDGTNDGNDDGTDDGNDDGTDDGNDNGNDDGTPNDPEDNPGDKSAWSMVGAFNNWGLSKSHIGLDIPDIPMSVKGTVHTAEATLYRGMGFKLRKDTCLLGSYKESYCFGKVGFLLAVSGHDHLTLVIALLVGYGDDLHILKLIGNNGFALFSEVNGDDRHNISRDKLARKTSRKGGNSDGDGSLFACEVIQICVLAGGGVAYLARKDIFAL